MTTTLNDSGGSPTSAGGAAADWWQWPDVHNFVNKLWDPENTPHHSIVGLTGSGKSFLAVNGLLKPMCKDDRVLIVDVKRNDPLVSSIGRGVTEIPAKTWNTRKREPYDNWFRLVVHDQFRREGRAKAQGQVFKALERVYHEGDWVVYLDELQDIGGTRQPNLGLSMHLDEVYRKGRSRRVSIVASTQAPRHVPTSFYDQCDFAWIGRITDEDKQKRLREIGGLAKDQLPLISTLKKRQWLLGADGGQHFLRTMVKVNNSDR